jgi:hypothetical protein
VTEQDVGSGALLASGFITQNAEEIHILESIVAEMRATHCPFFRHSDLLQNSSRTSIAGHTGGLNPIEGQLLESKVEDGSRRHCGNAFLPIASPNIECHFRLPVASAERMEKDHPNDALLLLQQDRPADNHRASERRQELASELLGRMRLPKGEASDLWI